MSDRDLEKNNDFTQEENIIEDKKDNTNKKVDFFPRLIAAFVDQAVALAISIGLLFAFDGILRLIGFFIADRPTMFFIIYVAVNVLYSPILESTKLRATLGKYLLRI